MIKQFLACGSKVFEWDNCGNPKVAAILVKNIKLNKI
jgi:hypothetical protein